MLVVTDLEQRHFHLVAVAAVLVQQEATQGQVIYRA
jgi:hypothetical protein